MNKTHVAVVHGNRRRENITSALNKLPASDWSGIEQAKTVLIKPNLVHHENQLASTHVDAVRGVLDIVRQKTDAKIIIADASYHGTKAAFQNFGFEHLKKEYDNIELFDLNDDEAFPGYYMKRDGSKEEMDLFSKTVAEADFTICLAQMKTHRDTGVTLTTKNWTVGTWVPEPRYGTKGKYWPRWQYLHEEGERVHHASIAELLHQNKPNLAVLDGFLAMEGDGPTRGEPVELNVALAGSDCVALDSVACRLMDIPVKDIGYLVMAADRGYGVGEVEQIELLGEKNIEALAKSFERPEDWEHVTAWRQ